MLKIITERNRYFTKRTYLRNGRVVGHDLEVRAGTPVETQLMELRLAGARRGNTGAETLTRRERRFISRMETRIEAAKAETRLTPWAR